MDKRKDIPDAEYETRGPGHKRKGHPRLSSHTPVRFEPETIAVIRRFSDEDGVTVSAWVRQVVNREIQRRINMLARTGSTLGSAARFRSDIEPGVASAASGSVATVHVLYRAS